MTATDLAPAAGAVGSDLARPHHDGSAAYVVDLPDELGEDAVVRLRVPRDSDVESVALRYVRDGEATVVRATAPDQILYMLCRWCRAL